MSKKLYVGNLVFSVDNAKLKEIFASYGEIEDAMVIVDKFSNRSKGFGFVTFSNDENADKAISEMNEKEVEGRKLTVNEARPMEERSDRDRPRRNFNDRGGGFGGNRDRDRGGFGGNRDRGRRY